MLLDTETGELYDDRLSVTVCELTKHRRQAKRGFDKSPEGSPLRKALLDFLSAEDEATFEAAAAQHPMLMTAARRIAEHTDDTLAALAEHMAACDANSMRAQRAREAAELRAKQERAIAAARRAAARQGKLEGKAEGLAEGKAEGLAEGKAEGLALGQRSATRAIAERLLAKGTARADVEEAIGTKLADLGL